MVVCEWNLGIVDWPVCFAVSVLQESSVENRENLQKEQEIESSGTQSPSSLSANVYDQEMTDPMDFLNAAVSVAIQKKGLTYA